MKQKKVTSKGMSKQQVTAISLRLRKYINDNSQQVLKEMDELLAKDIIIGTDERSQIRLQIYNHVNIVETCCDMFCKLYESCNVGPFKDRFSLLQIYWSEWVGKCLLCTSEENVLMVPDSISCSKSGAQQEQLDLSAVLHAIHVCMSFFESASKTVRTLKPERQNDPVLPSLTAQTSWTIFYLFLAAVCIWYIKSAVLTQKH